MTTETISGWNYQETTAGGFWCNKCQRFVPSWEPHSHSDPVIQYGWVCPKCGNVMGPQVVECQSCKRYVVTVSCQTP